MNFKNLTCILAFLFFGNAVQAQQVRYKVLEDDPSDYKAVSLSLEPFYADIHSVNIAAGFSVRADALIMRRFEVRADFRRSYWDSKSGEEGKNLLSVNGIKNQLFFEGGGSLFFTNKTRRKSLKVVLSSYTSGNYRHTKSIQVPAHVRSMWGIRGGFSYASTPVVLENDHTEYMQLLNKDGVDVSDQEDLDALTMFNRSTVYAGLTWKTIKSLVVSTDYGTKSNKNAADFYIDFLFAPTVNVRNIVKDDGTEYSVKFEGDNMKRMGWRTGWAVRSPNAIGLTYKFEMGSRPGYRSKKGITFENAFMMFTVGLNIPMSIRHIDKTND